MSKHETRLTEGFWESHANGGLLLEYPIVRKASDRARRLADAVILPDEPHGRLRTKDYPNLSGRNVIVVQTKKKRLGMYLMGQAFFSAGLVEAQGAASVRSVLLCVAKDGALLPLLKPFPEVEVWISNPDDPLDCRRV